MPHTLLTNFDMTNAELIQKIRAEIERLIEESDFDESANLYSLLSFLDTLELEKPMQEGLEEEIHEYNKERFDEYFPEQDGDFISEVDFMTCLDRVARHFYDLGLNARKEN